MASTRRQTNDTARGLRHHAAGGIRYLERGGDGDGDGPVAVFLHGIGSGSDSFAPLFEVFPEGPRLIAWNAPGYPGSDPLHPAHPVAADYAGALGRFLDALGQSQVTLVGHSLGTLIAAAFALREPGRVGALVLAASAQGYGMSAGDPLPPKAADRLAALDRLGPEAFAEARAKGLVFAPERNADVVARVRREMARIDPKGYAQAVHLLASGNLSGMVARIGCRPGFILGAEDRITPMDQTEAAMRAWAGAQGDMPRLIEIPGAGHAVYVQAPEAFADALLALVPGIAPQTPQPAEGELDGG